MEVVENAINKAKEVATAAYKKTGEIVNIEKQKIDIAVMESKLAKAYETLGRKYYEATLNTEIENEELKELAEDITFRTEKIEQAKVTLAAAKSKRVCPNCKKAIDENSVYCNFCGEKLIFEE